MTETELSLVTLDPGHFHAALVHQEMYSGVSSRAHVYAPLGPDVVAHVERVARLNNPAESPTAWELEVHTGPDFLERALGERAGSVAVIASRNHLKIDYVRAAVDAGLHVLADKPLILTLSDLPKLKSVLDTARSRGLVVADMMTGRYGSISAVRGALVNDREIFGTPIEGSVEEPAVVMESVHYLLKTAAGGPVLRPPWYFDILQQGSALADVGTHLVDEAFATLFPGQAIDQGTDIALITANHWPTRLTAEQLRTVTGGQANDREMPDVVDGVFEYDCNNSLVYTISGICVGLNVQWAYEAAKGQGDTHFSRYRGSLSSVEFGSPREGKGAQELRVIPAPGARDRVEPALRAQVAALSSRYPGIRVADLGSTFAVEIPSSHRTSHDGGFAAFARQFFAYVREPESFPAYEAANMLAKYYVTTGGVELAHRSTATRTL